MRITSVDSFKEKCTGCTACEGVCPVNAIEMKLDDEGFLFPNISDEICIDCGKCYKSCPAVCQHENNTFDAISIAYAADEDMRQSGSSGGIVGILSRRIKEQNGVVFGAVFDSNKQKVIHSSDENYAIEELSRSKYVQSECTGVFKDVECKLKDGLPVLFCGTPCQVAGLKAYLGKEYDSLYTVDFFCHGVPSPGYFSETLKQENNHGIETVNVSFREKAHGWRKLFIRFYSNDGLAREEKASDFHYYFFFLNNYSLRRSCYECNLYEKHSSDITVADFWQIDKEHDDDKGVSLILSHTEKAKQILKEVSDKLVYIDYDFAFAPSRYKHGYSLKNRNRFFDVYAKKGYQYISEEFFRRERKIMKKRKSLASLKGGIIHTVKKLFRINSK